MDTAAPYHPISKSNQAVPVMIKLLSHGGHYSVEMTALEQLHSAIEAFIEDCRTKDILLE